MYNPITDPFYPYKTETGITQVPLKSVLLGDVVADPFHPDPAIQAFLKYIPSLILQWLEIPLDSKAWLDLTLEDWKDSRHYVTFRDQVTERLSERQKDFFLHGDRNGFYQHYDVKTLALEGNKSAGCKIVEGHQQGLDGLLIHGVSGNNHCHHKPPGLLQKICPSCALVLLMHHNYFCVAGLAGPANIRGNQAYLCLIGEFPPSEEYPDRQDDSFKRMIRNTYFPALNDEDRIEANGWKKDKDRDQPSWKSPGKKKGKLFEVSIAEAGLLRSVFHTPRHAFFDIETMEDTCDFCGLASTQMIQRYFWRQGDKINQFLGHPTLATYEEKGKRLPLNYTPSVWKNLGPLVVKQYPSTSGKRFFEPAPLLRQFLKQRIRINEVEFQLEIQAYQTDKAKLEGFHEEVVRFPWFVGNEEEEQEFYQEIEHFTSTVTEMLRAFKNCGSIDKKRTKIPVPGITDKHDAYVQEWGHWTLQNLTRFYQAHKQETSTNWFLELLETYQTTLIESFEQLCASYAWDNLPAQNKLCKQKRLLANLLKKPINDFKKLYENSRGEEE